LRSREMRSNGSDPRVPITALPGIVVTIPSLTTDETLSPLAPKSASFVDMTRRIL